MASLRSAHEGISSSLRQRPNLRRILENAAWLSWDQIFRLAVGFLAGLWVARYLGVERWGILAYALALVGLFIPLVQLGIDGIMVRDLVLRPQAAGELMGTGFFIKAVGAAVAGLVALLLVVVLRPVDSESWRMVGILGGGLLFTSFDVIEYWYRSRVESRYAVLARNVGVAVSGIVKIALIVLGASVVAFAAAGALEYVVIAIGFLAVYRRAGGSLRRWQVRRATARGFLREGWPLALTAVCLSFLLQANEVLLGQFSGAMEVGIYGAARRLAEVWFFIPFAVGTSVGPALVTFRAEDPALYREKTLQVFRAMFAISVPIAILTTILAEPVVVLVYGEGFRQAALPLRAYIWGLPFFSWLVVQSVWDINEGLAPQRLQRTALAVAILLGFDLLLVPRLGAFGAALSATASFGVAGFLGNLASPKTHDVFGLQVRSLRIPIPAVAAAKDDPDSDTRGGGPQ